MVFTKWLQSFFKELRLQAKIDEECVFVQVFQRLHGLAV